MMIHVSFPTIMKMERTAAVSIEDCHTIVEVKKRIHETCKTTIDFYSHIYNRQLRVNNIIMRDMNHFEILTMDVLVERIFTNANFEVVFIEYLNG